MEKAVADCMIDLETWGTGPGCAIRSIGAVFFDPSGEGPTGETFYRNIDTWSCILHGLVIDRKTHEWWAGQGNAAREALAVNRVPLSSAVEDFHAWILKVTSGPPKPWSQGAGFDIPIWEAAARAVGKEAPWKFWDARDTRTVYGLAGFDPRSVPRSGVAHHALDDALYQVTCVQRALVRLRSLPQGGKP